MKNGMLAFLSFFCPFLPSFLSLSLSLSLCPSVSLSLCLSVSLSVSLSLPHSFVSFVLVLVCLSTHQEALGKTSQYAEAHRVQAKCDAMEQWELQQQHKQLADKLVKHETLFISKQDFEIAALYKRIQSGREEQIRARQAEWERCVLKMAVCVCVCVCVCCIRHIFERGNALLFRATGCSAGTKTSKMSWLPSKTWSASARSEHWPHKPDPRPCMPPTPSTSCRYRYPCAGTTNLCVYECLVVIVG